MNSILSVPYEIYHYGVFRNVSPLIGLGRRRALEQEDMPPLPDALHPRSVPESMLAGPVAPLLALLFRVLRTSLRRALFMGLLMILRVGLGLGAPLLVYAVLDDLQNAAAGTATLSSAAAHAIALAVVSVASALATQHFYYQALCFRQIIINILNTRIYLPRGGPRIQALRVRDAFAALRALQGDAHRFGGHTGA